MDQVNFTIFRNGGDRDGEIIRFGLIDRDHVELQLTPEDVANGFAFVDDLAFSFDLQYVGEGGVETRPTMAITVDKTTIAADGTDAATITSMPERAKLLVNGASFAPVDGTATLTSTIPQTFEIVISCWPFIDFPVTIEAN